MAERTEGLHPRSRTAMCEGGVLHKAPPVLEFASAIGAQIEVAPLGARSSDVAVVEAPAIVAPTGVRPPSLVTPFPVIERIVRRTIVDGREAHGSVNRVLVAVVLVASMAAFGALAGVAARSAVTAPTDARPRSGAVAESLPLAVLGAGVAASPALAPVAEGPLAPVAPRGPAVTPRLPPPPPPQELGTRTYASPPPIAARPASHASPRLTVKKPALKPYHH